MNDELKEGIVEESDGSAGAEDSALTEAAAKADEYYKSLLSLKAEYDNYRKRVQKEKEALWQDATMAVAAKFLPALDNVERGISMTSDESVLEGLNLIQKQVVEIFESLSVVPIPALGEEFNPELHSAVMHISDETVADNTIVEELQKGYMCKDKVLRFSMVKVAN